MRSQYPWSPGRFKRKLEQHGLTHKRGAELVGHTSRMAQYWLSRQGPPYVVCMVYELMERYGITPADIEAIGTELTKKRSGGN